MRVSVVAGLLVTLSSIAGCKKEPAKQAPGAATGGASAPASPASTSDQDALWALAPDDVAIGVVASPRALALAEGGVLELEKFAALVPELAPILADARNEVQRELGTTQLSAAALGLTTKKGFALFMTADRGMVAVVPVADRETFVRVGKGTKGTDGTDRLEGATCKELKGVYACAEPASLLDRLGKGLPDAMKLVGARGDIEVSGTIPGPQPTPIAAVAQLSRGAGTVRIAMKGLPPQIAANMPKPAKPRVTDTTTGFAVIDLTTMLQTVPPIPLLPGVTADALARSVSGPITVSSEAGHMMVDIRVPLSDTAPAQAAIDQCATVPPLAMLGATAKDGVCHVVPPMMPQSAIDAWVENKELRIGQKGVAPSKTKVPLSPIGSELAGGTWAFAFYGRGSMLAGPEVPSIPLPTLPPELLAGIRAFALVNELALGSRLDGDTLHLIVGLRTAWANPDDVVSKLTAITPEQIVQGKAGATARQIAEGAKGTPFASDVAAGWTGLLIPAATAGMLAAVAIPAYMDYMKKSKRSEAELMLNRMAKNLKVAYVSEGKLPVGTTAVTPATSCCQQGGKCFEPDAWTRDPVWKALEFTLDEPHLYRYRYESKDGQSFQAEAIADLDCDGIEVTYTLVGAVTNGELTTTLTAPPPNSD